MSKVNKDNVRKWVDALRSGKYIQGRYFLRNSNNNFCCLGVACDISELGKWVKNKCGISRYHCRLSSDRHSLPEDVADWLGLSTNPAVNVSTTFEGNYLARLNDECNYSFAQIADLIEETYLK